MEAELLNTVKDRYEYRDCGLWVKHQFNSGVVIGQRAGTRRAIVRAAAEIGKNKA